MNKRKKVLALLGGAGILFASFALVFAAVWTPDDMAVYMQNIGRHKIYQTNWILYNEIGPMVGAIYNTSLSSHWGQVGTTTGIQSWVTTGDGWTGEYNYDAGGYPKTISFWVNLWNMDEDDAFAITVWYETFPGGIRDKYSFEIISGNVDKASRLILDQLPIAESIRVSIEQTAGSAETIYYHAIIEEN